MKACKPQVTSSDHSKFGRTQATIATIKGSGSCESGASTNKAGPSYFSGLGTTPLGIKPLVGHLRCHDILLTEFMLYPPGSWPQTIKVQERILF
jgi:hypothetical protein